MKYYHFKKVLVILTIFISSNLFSRFKYERIDYVKVLERFDNSLNIKKYVKIKSEDRLFSNSYWKVYYSNDKIVGEELYQKNTLVYYYMYYHTQKKIYQKGFLWHGIYHDLKLFKTHGEYIKQGRYYKNYAETYRVYDKKTKKLTYSHNYQNFEY